MDRHHLLLASFLVLLAMIGVVFGSHAASPAEIYWHKVSPSVPMPSALQDLLHPDDKYSKNDFLNLANNKFYAQYAPSNMPSKTPPGAYGIYNGRTATKNTHQFHYDSNMPPFFFLEEDLLPGANKSILFLRNIANSPFIPRKEAESISFSSAKLPEILHHFAIEPNSVKADAIRTTLDKCEVPESEGEHKFCATSLESMVESSMLALGTRNVQAVSTAVSKDETPKKQLYTVAAPGMKRLPGSDTVACHPSLYPYAVYYCHSVKGTRGYRVALTGKEGAKVDAVAVCHTETADWNPEHVAFKLLKVKPGAIVCHFLPQDHILWTRTH